MRWGLVTFLAIATVVLVAIAWLQSGGAKQHAIFSAVTPEEAVQALMSQIQAHNYQQAYASLDRSSGTDLASFIRSEEHTSELQSLRHLVCRLLLEKKKRNLSRTRSC